MRAIPTEPHNSVAVRGGWVIIVDIRRGSATDRGRKTGIDIKSGHLCKETIKYKKLDEGQMISGALAFN